MLESEYTVVSNISRHGVPPVEAAAHIADLIVQILEKKKSGVEFSKQNKDMVAKEHRRDVCALFL